MPLMPDPAAITDPAGMLALASARRDAEDARRREEVRLGVNDCLLQLADELEQEAAWRPDTAAWSRREGRHAEADKLESEARGFRMVAAYLKDKLGLYP
jgi:hypothetical protein